MASVAEVTWRGWGMGHVVRGGPRQQLGFICGRPLENLNRGVTRPS